MMQRDKFYKTVYFGGIEQQLRRELWPFLLHHYELESTADERREIDLQMRRIYEEAMTEWCAHIPSRPASFTRTLNTFFSSLQVSAYFFSLALYPYWRTRFPFVYIIPISFRMGFLEIWAFTFLT